MGKFVLYRIFSGRHIFASPVDVLKVSGLAGHISSTTARHLSLSININIGVPQIARNNVQ